MPITIGVLREVTPGETRVALVPEVAAKFRAAGVRVLVERGAGAQAQFPDTLWKDVDFAEQTLSQTVVAQLVEQIERAIAEPW